MSSSVRVTNAKEFFVIQYGKLEICLGNRVLETLCDYSSARRR
jgi:hypothetical protein